MRENRSYYAGLYVSVLLKLTISETKTVVKASIAQKKGGYIKEAIWEAGRGKGTRGLNQNLCRRHGSGNQAQAGLGTLRAVKPAMETESCRRQHMSLVLTLSNP